MKKLIFAAAAVMMMFALTGCSGSKNEESDGEPKVLTGDVLKPLDDYFAAFNEDKPELLVTCSAPQVCIDKMKEGTSYDDAVEGARSNIEEIALPTWLEQWGENCQSNYVGDVMGVPLTETEIICAENYYKGIYGDFDAEVKVKEGYAIEFDFCVGGDKDKAEGVQKAVLTRPENDEWKLITIDVESLSLRWNGVQVEFGNVNDD